MPIFGQGRGPWIRIATNAGQCKTARARQKNDLGCFKEGHSLTVLSQRLDPERKERRESSDFVKLP